MRRAALFLLVASILVSGCLAASAERRGEGSTPSPVPTTLPQIRPTVAPAPAVAASQAEAEVRTAMEDLAHRLAVDANAIAVVSVMVWEWPNASLGVPHERRIYPPVTTPGYIIVLEAQGRPYEYHSDTHGRVVYAPKGLITR